MIQKSLFCRCSMTFVVAKDHFEILHDATSAVLSAFISFSPEENQPFPRL